MLSPAIGQNGKVMSFVPDRGQLASREEAIRIAEYYPAGLKVGNFVEVNAPHAVEAFMRVMPASAGSGWD